MTDSSQATVFVVAIDGPAGSGKSSVSKQVARRLGYGFLDTGAAYRALAWHALEHGVDTSDSTAVLDVWGDFDYAISLDPDALHHTTRLTATTDQPVPVSFGYHPYLTLPGVAREDFLVTFPVRRQMLLDDRGIPTGTDEVANIPPGALGDRTYDDGFSELREPIEFGLEGGGRRLGVRFDEGYPYAQVWAPPGEQFICYEPMTAPTNALVTHDGLAFARPDDAYEARFSLLVIGV